ncbi:MAG: four helix bundle suffix domain-containing protein [Muribaculaceae bacterium]|nr:four helix bundle suffix domain-containing protein [Muribaculaceae bacterium]
MASIIKTVGDYKKLLSYQKADTIYQITFYFCHQYLKIGDRTIDQMIQAARSGKQNIIEGCADAATSAKLHISLLNVAKASLKELLEDYEDYLKTRNFRQWQKGDVEYEAMRELGRKQNEATYFMNLIKTRPSQTIANMAIILINQADYLLHRQIAKASEEFENEGGFSERMTRVRKERRGY